MVMFLAGSHVPIRDPALRGGTPIALLRLVGVGGAAAVLGQLVALAFHTGHGALYAVLFASSSAAIVLPAIDSLQLTGPAVLALLPQVAIADTACIVALPLAMEPGHAGAAAAGAAVVLVAALGVFLLLQQSERRGWRKKLHRKSGRRKFALELRISLLILLLLGTLAASAHISIMLAGFSLGLAVAAVGAPRRLARQLFALTEGLFAPIFFVWLGASLDLRELQQHPTMLVLGLTLAACAVLAHTTTAITSQPLPLAVLASAQLGVPVAAATLGQQLHLLDPGEPAALLLGALLTVAAASTAGRLTDRTALHPE